MGNGGLWILVIALSFACGILLAKALQAKKKKESVTSAVLETKISDCSDLTTCNLEYVDLVKYSSGTIPLMTKKSFSMIYHASIRAGIDLSNAKVKLTPASCVVTLPPTQIQAIDVDTDSLRFYDEHFALFNWNEKEDISQAIKMAKDDVQAHAHLDQLKAQARRQAEIVVYKLIQPAVGEGRKLVIE